MAVYRSIARNYVLRNALLWLVILSIASACKTTQSSDTTTQSLQALLDQAVQSDLNPTPGLSLAVYAPDLDLSWTGAAGVSDIKTKETLRAEQTFRVASITKTFVATAIWVLHERGALDVNQSIEAYISAAHIDLLKKGGYDPSKILIKHCLHHSSGLFDYAVGSETYLHLVSSQPDKRWTRTEQLEGAMKWGTTYGEPGEEYHYSDTGYILLGEIIERITTKNLGLSLRQILGYEKLGLAATYLESLDDTIASSLPQVHRYLGREDATTWDNSIDLYGGGGLVSTSADLAKFYFHVFNGQLFLKKETMEGFMMPSRARLPAGITDDYRSGFQVVTIFGEEAYMHGGFWGTFVLYIPAYNASIAINLTKDGPYQYLIKEVITLLKNHAKAAE